MKNKVQDSGPFFHGTKADLKSGDLLSPNHNTNYDEKATANYIYFTATMDAAAWGAELAVGDKPGRIYRVEPTGIIEDDPNLTDKKFPGNPTRSYRSKSPLKVLDEVIDWTGHSENEIRNMLDNIAKLKKDGIEAIND